MAELRGRRYVLETTDLNGMVVRFTKIAFDKHKDKHPDLKDPTFMPARIVRALQTPHLIMPNYSDKYSVCYYYQEFGGPFCRFTKVVVDISNHDMRTGSDVYYIKTAFRPDNIKEHKYKLKPIYHDGTKLS